MSEGNVGGDVWCPMGMSGAVRKADKLCTKNANESEASGAFQPKFKKKSNGPMDLRRQGQ